MYQYVLTSVTLFFCAVTDLKCQKVYKAFISAYLSLALFGHLLNKSAHPAGIAIGLIPGVFCFLISWISRQGLGYGDSALAAVCGISLGFWNCTMILFIAFFLCGLWAIGLLVLQRAGREKEIPLVPFLFVGMILQWVGGM